MPPSTNGTTPSPTTATAADFRSLGDAVELELPDSGFTVMVGRAHISDLAAAGLIPSELSGVAARIIGTAGATPIPTELAQAARETQDIIDAVCCAALREPRMVPSDTPVHEHPDALRPRDMPYADRERVFAYVARLGDAARYARFPGRPTGGLAPVADGEGLQDPAE